MYRPAGIQQRSRRAAVVVQVAVMSTLILGMAALAVDVGMMYATRTELQVAADAAALAAAQNLVSEGGGQRDATQLARLVAEEYAARHKASGRTLALGPSDVQFGRGVFNPNTRKYKFTPSNGNYDAVRITTRRSSGSAAGALPLTFANFFGIGSSNLRAQAAAVLIPRDIAVVIDLSGSMTWDSSLRFRNRNDGGYSNARDIWAALDGPEPSRPYQPGSELETEYAGDFGPAIGGMTDWGNPLLPGIYNPASDSGLTQIRRSQDLANTVLTTALNVLSLRGYSLDETLQLTTIARDANAAHFRRRAAVLLGLADWKSGRLGGNAGGNGDNVLDAVEMVWDALPPFSVNWTWDNYVDFVQSANVSDAAFRYRYGLKTFVDFILENRPQASQTRDLWRTPQQPLRAVKDSVQAMVDVVAALDSLDRMSLTVFGTTARHEIDLTSSYQQVADRLYTRQAAHYDPATNIGGGLAAAIAELTGPRARGSARKYIVLMSDGVPNVDARGSYVGDGAAGASNYAYDQARRARDEDIVIYCVSVGYGVDRSVMQAIAALAGGQEFYASGNPEQYTEELQMIFRSLGGRRPVALIE